MPDSKLAAPTDSKLDMLIQSQLSSGLYVRLIILKSFIYGIIVLCGVPQNVQGIQRAANDCVASS